MQHYQITLSPSKIHSKCALCLPYCRAAVCGDSATTRSRGRDSGLVNKRFALHWPPRWSNELLILFFVLLRPAGFASCLRSAFHRTTLYYNCVYLSAFSLANLALLPRKPSRDGFTPLSHLTSSDTMSRATRWRDAASPSPCRAHGSPCGVGSRAGEDRRIGRPCYGDGNRARHDGADCIGTRRRPDGSVRSRGRRRRRHGGRRRPLRPHNVDCSKTRAESSAPTSDYSLRTENINRFNLYIYWHYVNNLSNFNDLSNYRINHYIVTINDFKNSKYFSIRY